MKALIFIINGAIVLFIGVELILIVLGRISADQLLVSSGVSGIVIVVSLKLLKDAMLRLYGLTEHKRKAIQKELDILEAIDFHIKLKVGLQKFLSGNHDDKLNTDAICHDDQCALGKWINQSGRSETEDNEGFRMLRAKHSRFHNVAGKIVNKARENQLPDAQAMMSDEFKYASHDLMLALTELNKLVMSK